MESSTNLLSVMQAFFLQQGLEKNYILGFSGGLDSTVLLALCQAIRNTLPIHIHAVHIHHDLSVHADRWAMHCKQFCVRHDIPFSLEKIAIKKQNKGLEAAARDSRYNIFANYCQGPNSVLLTAHHLNDQAETFLLQLLRGSGPKGLAAMPSEKPLGRGVHARPLLACRRETLLKYARFHHLTWIEDESNENLTFTRNVIRHKILPLLQGHFPAAPQVISRASRHIAEMQSLTESMAMLELKAIAGSVEHTLSINHLKLLTAPKQRLLLRLWLYTQNIYPPNEKKLAQIQAQMMYAAADRNPQISFGDSTIRRYRDNLYLTKRSEASAKKLAVNQKWIWHVNHALHIPGIGLLQSQAIKNDGLRRDIDKVAVIFRQGGETITLHGRGRLSLKNLFQAWGVPPWMRHKIPLLYFEDELVAVVGFYLHPLFTEKNGMGKELKIEHYS